MIRWIRRQTRRWWWSVGPIWREIARFLSLPWSWFAWLGKTTIAGVAFWYRSRQWRRLLYGIPCLAVFSALAYFVVAFLFTQTDQLARDYERSGRAEAVAGQWDAATLYFERAYELGIKSPEMLFQLAKAAENAGDEARMAAVLQRLAPGDRAVHGPSHLWRAIQFLSKSPVSPAAQAAAEQQLRLALELNSSDPNAHGLLGELYHQRGFHAGAATHLSQASRESSHYQILYARSCLVIGRRQEAAQAAESARNIAFQKLGEDPRDIETRVQLVSALHILEEFERAIEILREGMQIHDAKERMRGLAARIYLAWAEVTLNQPTKLTRNRKLAFDLVSRAMSVDPNNSVVFDQMMELVSFEDEASEAARAFLRDNIAVGRALGMSHLLLGTSLQEAGDTSEAAFHLEQAFEILPEAPVVANNLAWHLLHSESPDLVRAHALIDKVIQDYPNIPAYIDTRGHLHLAEGNWKDAISDFQVSLTQFASEPTVHEGLAHAYRELGMKSLADRHRGIAAALRVSGTEQTYP